MTKAKGVKESPDTEESFAAKEVLISDIVQSLNHSCKFRLAEEYRPIAEALVAKFSELSHIPVKNMLFIENSESAPSRRGRYTLAQIGPVPGMWSEIIEQLTGAKVYWWMEIFKKRTKDLSREQIIALVYHELRHVGRGGGLVGHDIEDWSVMVNTFGTGWNHSGAKLPDLLDFDVDWSTISARKLVEDFEAADGEEGDDEADSDDETADEAADNEVADGEDNQSETRLSPDESRSFEGVRKAARRLGYQPVPPLRRAE